MGTADPVLILSSINPKREVHVFDFLDSLNKVTGILRVLFQMVSFSLFKSILKHYFVVNCTFSLKIKSAFSVPRKSPVS